MSIIEKLRNTRCPIRTRYVAEAGFAITIAVSSLLGASSIYLDVLAAGLFLDIALAAVHNKILVPVSEAVEVKRE